MARKEEYYESILTLMQQYGIRGLTMEQVATKLGITKRTLYNHFGNKQEMLMVVMDNHVQNSITQIERVAQLDGLNAITVQTSLIEFICNHQQRLSPLFVKSIYDNYPEMFNRYDAIRREKAYEFYLCNIKRGRNEGLYHIDFDPQIISLYIFRTFDGFWQGILNDEYRFDSSDAFRQIICCILRGLVTPKGSEILEKEIKRIYKR